MDPVNPAMHEFTSVKPLQLSAPKDSVDHFHSLLTSTVKPLQNSSPALRPHAEGEKIVEDTLIHDTAKRLNKAEVALGELGWEIRKSIQNLGSNAELDSRLVHSITDLKYKTTAYFMNMMRAESGFSSLGEEAESITRRRG